MAEVKAGLQDLVIATSEICSIDGQQGKLLYRGYDIHDLAEHSTFEEVVCLLLNGRLPKQAELDDLKEEFADNRTLSPEVIGLLKRLPPARAEIRPHRPALSGVPLARKDFGVPRGFGTLPKLF